MNVSWVKAFESTQTKLSTRSNEPSHVELILLISALLVTLFVAIRIQRRLAKEQDDLIVHLNLSTSQDIHSFFDHHEDEINQYLLMRTPFRPRLSNNQARQPNFHRFQPIPRARGKPLIPPTEVMLQWLVPTRSIWPSYYIRAAKRADTLADKMLAQQEAKPPARLSASQPVPPKLPASSQGGIRCGPFLPLEPEVQKLIDEIPSDDDSEILTPPLHPLTQKDAPRQDLVKAADQFPRLLEGPAPLCACTESTRTCFPIYISTNRIMRDWAQGKIQPREIGMSIYEVISEIYNQACADPLSPDDADKVQGSSRDKSGDPTKPSLARWYIHLVLDEEEGE